MLSRVTSKSYSWYKLLPICFAFKLFCLILGLLILAGRGAALDCWGSDIWLCLGTLWPPDSASFLSIWWNGKSLSDICDTNTAGWTRGGYWHKINTDMEVKGAVEVIQKFQKLLSWNGRAIFKKKKLIVSVAWVLWITTQFFYYFLGRQTFDWCK